MCGRYVIKIRNMKVEEFSFLGMSLVHADGRTDGHDKTSSSPSHANAHDNFSGSARDLNALLSTECY
jgi:hypothetical protein